MTTTAKRTRLRASFDNILAVRLAQEDRMTPGGIALPGDAKGVPWKVRVVDVGPGRVSAMTGELVPMGGYEVDDVVLVPPFSDFIVQVGGVEYIICSENKILSHYEEVPA